MAETSGAAERLTALKAMYRERCRVRIADVDRLAANMAEQGAGAVEDVRMLRRIAHELHGSGGSFGYPAISAAGGVLEEICDGLLAGAPLDSAALDAAVACLREACRDQS